MPCRRKRPDPADDLILEQPRGKKQKQSRAASKEAKEDVAEAADLITLIDNANGTSCDGVEAEGDCVEVTDGGVDQLDETSSIASGPSQLSHSSTWRAWTLLDLCIACQKLYRRIERSKAPLKNKLLDTDPDSLTCHLWVLIKARRPRRPPGEKRDLQTIVQTIKRLQLQTPNVGEGEPPVCVRPRAFLQRNLRRVKVAAKKKKRKDRHKRARSDVTAEVTPHPHSPPTVAQKSSQPKPVSATQRAPTRFEMLLSQMHSNRSTIIRESSA